MLYFFYGDNNEKKRQACDKLVSSLSPEDDALFFMNDIDFEEDRLEEHIFSSGLFSSKSVIILENVLENKEVEDFILKKLKDIKNSKNAFIFLERDAGKKLTNRLEKFSEKIELFKIPKTLAKKTFNIFSLADALGRRDKKKAWILYQKALDSGIAPEEIVNILFWQLKTMLLVKGKSNNSEAIKETSLNPFVFKKAYSFSKNFSDEELKKLSSRFTSIHHESRRTNRDLVIDLERVILESI